MSYWRVYYSKIIIQIYLGVKEDLCANLNIWKWTDKYFQLYMKKLFMIDSYRTGYEMKFYCKQIF